MGVVIVKVLICKLDLIISKEEINHILPKSSAAVVSNTVSQLANRNKTEH